VVEVEQGTKNEFNRDADRNPNPSSLDCRPGHPLVMPVPRHIIEQIKQLIPPLNGSLRKGQSGAQVGPSIAIPRSFNCDRSSRCARRCTRVRISGYHPDATDADHLCKLHWGPVLCSHVCSENG